MLGLSNVLTVLNNIHEALVKIGITQNAILDELQGKNLLEEVVKEAYANTSAKDMQNNLDKSYLNYLCEDGPVEIRKLDLYGLHHLVKGKSIDELQRILYADSFITNKLIAKHFIPNLDDVTNVYLCTRSYGYYTKFNHVMFMRYGTAVHADNVTYFSTGMLVSYKFHGPAVFLLALNSEGEMVTLDLAKIDYCTPYSESNLSRVVTVLIDNLFSKVVDKTALVNKVEHEKQLCSVVKRFRK